MQLKHAMASAKVTAGSTHNFYLYPARFSPEIARTVIELFSSPGDWILDPFMGGGTAVIEALSNGRSVVGVDLNRLAHFVARVRTTPVSSKDERAIRRWAQRAAMRLGKPGSVPSSVRNLPAGMANLMAQAMRTAARLRSARRRAFARAALLRLGQWALDCKDRRPRGKKILERLPSLTQEMLAGLREFEAACRSTGLMRSDIHSRCRLLCRSAAGLEQDKRLRNLHGQAQLVFTSPPYPSVHVLYHRWQVRGRRETPAPYWIAQLRDGRPASYFTGGSRTPTGERSYFTMITAVFSSINRLLTRDGLVVQLVGFTNARRQLPRYLKAMRAAGFEELQSEALRERRLCRRVPNRRWYARVKGAVDASSEILLIHRLRRP